MAAIQEMAFATGKAQRASANDVIEIKTNNQKLPEQMKELWEWQDENVIEFKFLKNWCHELKKTIDGMAGLRELQE